MKRSKSAASWVPPERCISKHPREAVDLLLLPVPTPEIHGDHAPAAIGVGEAQLSGGALGYSPRRSFWVGKPCATPCGIEVTHDHPTREGAIPLPATLTMLTGKRIGAHGSGAQTRLYSPFHFPGGRRRVAYTMPLARKRGALCNITPASARPAHGRAAALSRHRPAPSAALAEHRTARI